MVDSWQFVGSTGHTWSSSGADNVSFAYNAGFDDSRCGEGYVYRTIDVPSFGGELVIHASGSIAWASHSIDVLINDVLKKQFLSSGSSTIPINETIKIDVCEHAGTNIKIEVHHNDSSTPTCSYPDHANNITLTGICIESVPIPVISSIGTSPYPPKLCEPITFTNLITWNDAGGTGTRKVWWQYTTSTAEYTIESCGAELLWTQFADAQWPEHTFTEEHKDITHVRCIAENMSGVCGCAMIENFSLESTNGFTITLDSSLSRKPLLVWHATKMPWLGLTGDDPNLWFSAYGWVRGTWNSANPNTAYKVGTGDIRNNATPTFDETALGTLFDGNMRDGYDCVVLARDNTTLMEFGIFQEKDIFKIHSGSPTCVHLITTSSDVVTEAVMGPVCDFFGISRGSECDMFWAEFYDPVYVANYISILTTGQDTIGTSRELTAIDHIAFPFSVLGSLPGLSFLPFGALITNGLEAMSKAGARFGDTATRFMLDFSMDAAHKISKKDTWYFLDAIGQTTEAHATEIVNALTAGDVNTAETLLRQYAGESKGWWNYHTLNDMLKDALPLDTYNWLRTQMGLLEIGAGTVTNTAKQTTLSADCVLKLADAVADTEVMDAATLAVYRSLKILDTATTHYIDEVRNVLKNSPEISAKLVRRHKTMLDDVAAGRTVLDRSAAKAIFNHADLAPDDIVGMIQTADNLPSIVNKLTDGTFSQALGNFLDSTKKYWDYVNTQVGKTEADTWVRNNAEASKKAMGVDSPAKMADIPHSGQDIAADADNTIADFCGGHPEVTKTRAEDIIYGEGKKVGDEISEVTQIFPDEATTNWYTKARQRANVVPDRLKKKWKGLKRYEKVLVIWFMVDNVAFIVYMIAKFLGLGPGDRGFTAWSLAKSVTDAKWVCKEACDDKRYDDLESGIAVLECAITNLENHLDTYEFSLKLSNSYEAPSTICEIGKLALKLYQECLVNKGIEVAPSTGKIVFFAVDTAGQAVTSGAYVDGRRVGTIWGSGLSIDEVDPGNYDIEIKTTGYVGCTKTVSVVANQDSTFECILTPIIDCSEVSDVSIYIDPMSPEEDETISFNGAADSDNAILSDGWEWDFDDDSPNKVGQAVTHTYSSDGIYAVKLTVTNECGSSSYTTRNVTVSEEEPPTESTTLQIEIPIDEDGNEIDRYWDVEIWVDGKYTACDPPHTLTFGTGVHCDCTSPWDLVDCELGTHTITLKKAGYDDKTISVYLKKDEPKTWHSPVMVKSAAAPTMHTIRFSVPEGSNLHIDGVSLSRLSTVTRISELFKSMRK